MSKYRIAAVVFDGFEMLDLYGPLEMYCMHPDLFEIRAVAQSTTPVRAHQGLTTLPDETFDDDQPYDILVVPGGTGARAQAKNPVLLGWLARAAASAQLVTSVCTGSLLLAKAGLLDGHAATTNKEAFHDITAMAPQVTWRKRARWVESGRFITSSGVSAGMDMTLAVIEKLEGPKAAQDAADWAEYTRNHDPDNDPFAIE